MSFDIPLFDLNYGPEEERAVLATLRSKWIATGPNVAEVEKRFCAHLGVSHAVAVTNCTAALHLALVAAGIGAGDEVIVPSLTFVATVNAVKYVGATPVFADITAYDDLSIDPDEIERKVSTKTKAVIVMHYGGFCCDMDAIGRIAEQNQLVIIEDAAHAPSADYKGRKAGAIGHIGCFSFYSNKNISCAEGGLLVTNNRGYAEKARLFRSHGMTTISYDRARGHATSYDVVGLGFNYRLDDIRAALLLAQMDKLPDDISRRETLREQYIEQLGGISGLIIPYRNRAGGSANYIFPVVLADGGADTRELVRDRLKQDGIQTSVHYPAVHRFSLYRDCPATLPNTDYVTDNEFTLPLFPGMSPSDVDRVCSALRRSL